MKLFLHATLVLAGTLLAAALVALGEPAKAEVQIAQAAPGYDVAIASLFGLD
jgi:hypothetical protein